MKIRSCFLVRHSIVHAYIMAQNAERWLSSRKKSVTGSCNNTQDKEKDIVQIAALWIIYNH